MWCPLEKQSAILFTRSSLESSICLTIPCVHNYLISLDDAPDSTFLMLLHWLMYYYCKFNNFKLLELCLLSALCHDCNWIWLKFKTWVQTTIFKPPWMQNVVTDSFTSTTILTFIDLCSKVTINPLNTRASSMMCNIHFSDVMFDCLMFDSVIPYGYLLCYMHRMRLYWIMKHALFFHCSGVDIACSCKV